MNLDIEAQIAYGDGEGLRAFFLAHHMAHSQISGALARANGVTVGTQGLDSPIAEDAWVEMMKPKDERMQTPQALTDWLQLHAQIHSDEYEVLFPSITQTLDLSLVDFGNAAQFYDWMWTHQVIHDQEAQLLNLT